MRWWPGPGWAVAGAVGAPALLIGGWTVAAARQPHGYDPARATISALAGEAATDRWVMTAALAGLGCCYLLVAAGLRPAARPGRAVLALGGALTVLVAALPLPAAGGSAAHTAAAGAAFVALALWPGLAARRPGPGVARVSRRLGWGVTTVLLVLLGWLAAELAGGDRLGTVERLAAGAESLVPLLLVGAAHRGGAADTVCR